MKTACVLLLLSVLAYGAYRGPTKESPRTPTRQFGNPQPNPFIPPPQNIPFNQNWTPGFNPTVNNQG